MSGSGPFETDVHEGPDLGRLSAAERKVLELLAQGHTAKSIAALTGQSEGAINERLRSARRKTGVGSSRELARRLGAQKNRAENIGVSVAGRAVAGEGAQPAPKRAWLARSKGPLLMFLTLSAAAAAAALLLQATSPTPPSGPPFAGDPLTGSALPEQPPNFHSLHDQVRGEPRAADWAARTEAALRAAYDRAYRAGASQASGKSVLRVICGSTLCEAAGWMDGDRAPIDAVMQALQGRQLDDDAKAAGLSAVGMSFGAPHDHSERMAFVGYWKRMAGATPTAAITTADELMAASLADFQAHQPRPADFRNVRLGRIERQDGPPQLILCGEFLPAGERNPDWAAFATIQTSGYEQHLGAEANTYCNLPELKWQAGADLAGLLKSKLAAPDRGG